MIHKKFWNSLLIEILFFFVLDVIILKEINKKTNYWIFFHKTVSKRNRDFERNFYEVCSDFNANCSVIRSLNRPVSRMEEAQMGVAVLPNADRLFEYFCKSYDKSQITLFGLTQRLSGKRPLILFNLPVTSLVF